MKKLFVISSLFAVSICQLCAQNPFRVWVNRFDQNQASNNDVPGSLEVCTDGGYMAVTNNGANGFVILKYNSTGTLQWSRDFAPGIGRCGVPLSDGTYVAVGNSGNLEAVKTDAGGNVLWAKTYLAATQGNYVQQTLDGGLMMGGNGTYGGELIKTDINGVVQWSKSYAYSSGGISIHKGVQLSDSSYVMGACGGNGMVLFKTDKTGTLKWNHEYRLTGVVSYTMGLRKTSDNGFIMCGTDNYEFWHVIKTDSAGNIQWSNKYKPNSVQGATYDVEELDYGFAVVGMYYDGIGFSASYLMKIDPAGNVLWNRIFQEPYWEEFHSVKQTADKGLVMWGRAQTNGGQFGDLIKTDSLGLGVCGDSTTTMVATVFASTVTSPTINVSSGSATASAITNTFSGSAAVESYPCAIAPVAAFSANKTTVCKGDTVTFQDLSANGPTGWQWTFDKGTPGSSTTQNPVVVYDTTGAFNVKLVVKNSYGADSLTKTAYITVNTAPVAGTVSASPDSVCPGATSQLTATGNSSTVQWQTSTDGVSFADISLANSTGYTTPALAQTTYYRVEVSGQCGTDSSLASSVVVVPQPFTGSINAVPGSVCPGGSSTLSLTGVNGTIQWQSSPTGTGYVNAVPDSTSFTTAPLTQPIYYRVVVNNAGCADTSNGVPISVYPVPVTPTVSTTDSLICSSDSALITSSPAYASYQWNDGDTTGYTHATTAGGYWVSVTDNNGCTAVSGHQQITVYPVPSVSIELQGDTLASFNYDHYQWFYNDTPITGATASVYVAHQTGEYAVQIIDTNNCPQLSQNTLVTVDTETGLPTLGEENISVYPNPSSGSWQLAVDNSLVGSPLEVYDEEGRLIFNSKLRTPNSKLDLNVPAGVYYLKIRTGAEEYVKKLVKVE